MTSIEDAEFALYTRYQDEVERLRELQSTHEYGWMATYVEVVRQRLIEQGRRSGVEG